MIAFALIIRPAYEWAHRRIDRLLFNERYDYLEALRLLFTEADALAGSPELGARLAELIRRVLTAAGQQAQLGPCDPAAIKRAVVEYLGRTYR